MTESFKNVLHNESCLCQAVITVMALDMGKEELSSLTLYRPFLSLVDNYISFYQKKSQSSVQVPIFYMLGANDEMRKLLENTLLFDWEFSMGRQFRPYTKNWHIIKLTVEKYPTLGKKSIKHTAGKSIMMENLVVLETP